MPTMANRAWMSTATTGTGTITLGSALSGYQTFADAGITDGQTVAYVIIDGANWEVGTGTYTSSGTTLTRSVTESSNADSAINLSGSASVFITARATDLAILGNAQTWTAVQGYALNTLTYNASQTWNVSTNPCAHLSPTGNVTSFSCSGVTAGRFYLLKITQDTSARTIAYTGANFKFIGGSAPTLSTGSGAVDYHVFVGVSSTLLHEVGRAQNVS